MMSEWLRQRETGSEPDDLPKPWEEGSALYELVDVVPLDDIIGTAEALQLAGLTNRGSIPYHQEKNGFPQPVKQLAGGTRLWSRTAVEEWARERTRADNEE